MISMSLELREVLHDPGRGRLGLNVAPRHGVGASRLGGGAEGRRSRYPDLQHPKVRRYERDPMIRAPVPVDVVDVAGGERPLGGAPVVEVQGVARGQYLVDEGLPVDDRAALGQAHPHVERALDLVVGGQSALSLLVVAHLPVLLVVEAYGRVGLNHRGPVKKYAPLGPPEKTEDDGQGVSRQQLYQTDGRHGSSVLTAVGRRRERRPLHGLPEVPGDAVGVRGRGVYLDLAHRGGGGRGGGRRVVVVRDRGSRGRRRGQAANAGGGGGRAARA